MRYALLLMMMLLADILNLQAANYYFSSTLGDDSRTPLQVQNPETPWKTIAKLNAVFNSLNPGDLVYFKRGEVFYGSVIVTRSGSTGNPIVFDAYGVGERPVITGLTTLSNWTNKGSGVYEAGFNEMGSAVNVLLVNGRPMALGRYPNATAANKGYLYYESAVGRISITDNQLPLLPNWSGGEVVIRKNRWVLDRNKILLHAGPLITYASQSNYNADVNFGYFIQNHPQTLDLPGEWYYESNSKKVGVYFGNTGAADVQVSSIPTLVHCTGQQHIRFSGITFRGSNTNLVELNRANQVTFTNCEFLFAGLSAVNALNCNELTIQYTLIRYSNNIGLNLNNCSGTTIRSNRIVATGIFPGMGDGGAGSYEGIMVAGNNNLLELNQIDSTGYIPITFSGNDVLIKNNFINRFAFVKDDAGGIYTYNGSGTPQVNSGRKIIGNIILNGIGAGEGTNNQQSTHVNGIYIDDKSNNVLIENNTVAHCGKYGLYLHNANSITIRKNTLYNNLQQVGMVHDQIAPNNPIRQVLSEGNLFFSRAAGAATAEFKSIKNDLAEFGTFNNNYYVRPFDDYLTINTSRKVGGTTFNRPYDLAGWQTVSNEDQQSRTSPVQLKNFQLNNLSGANKFTNGSFTANINGLYTWSAAGNSRITWHTGVLDGGALKLSFTTITGTDRRALVVIKSGALAANKQYLLRFTSKGSNEPRFIETYLRKSLSGYTDLTERRRVKLSPDRTEHEVLFKANSSELDASIVFEIEEQQGPLYLDNIQLFEANVTLLDPDDQIRFEYNASATANSIPLGGRYIDVNNRVYNGSITLDPYTSVVLMRPAGGVVANPGDTFPGCITAGYVEKHNWIAVGGNNVRDIPVQTSPSRTDTLTALEYRNTGVNYGTSIAGVICAPLTGAYTFFLAGDDAAELYLSADTGAGQQMLIASLPGWTNFRQWDKFPSQQSGVINLVQGNRYFFRVLHKQGGGGNHLSVAWRLPDGTMELPILGRHLSPTGDVQIRLEQSISFDALPAVTLGNPPVSLIATASSGLPVSFQLVSGAAVINGNTITPTAEGTIAVRAIQDGNASYQAAPPVTQYLVVAPLSNLSGCTATGAVSLHQWSSVPGNTIGAIPVQLPASSSSELSLLEVNDIPVNTASRLEGYFCAPQDGKYQFFLSGDDAAELWLSTNDLPDEQVRIARVISWTNFREWNKFSAQTSGDITLVAGKKYYLRVLHKQGAGGGHFSVGCTLPDGTAQLPMPATHCSPFVYLALSIR